MSATLLGSALVGSWYFMNTKYPSKPNKSLAKRNDANSLIKRVQPTKRNAFHPFHTGLTTVDKNEKIFNYGCPAWKDKNVINNYIKMKDDIWLTTYLSTDKYDGYLNERNWNPKYNGAVVPLGKKKSEPQVITLLHR